MDKKLSAPLGTIETGVIVIKNLGRAGVFFFSFFFFFGGGGGMSTINTMNAIGTRRK